MVMKTDYVDPNPALVALLDMDGTVVDYDGQMRSDLEKLQGPEEAPYIPGPGDHPPHIEARMDLIKSQVMWWYNLPGHQPGFRVVGLLRERGFRIHVLTKGPYRTLGAWTEKVRWVREHLPFANVSITDDKSLTYGAVLVDDWIPYVEGWLEYRPRGLVIMPAHTWNEGFSHPQVIRFTGTPENVEEVGNRLDMVVQRISDRVR